MAYLVVFSTVYGLCNTSVTIERIQIEAWLALNKRTGGGSCPFKFQIPCVNNKACVTPKKSNARRS